MGVELENGVAGLGPNAMGVEWALCGCSTLIFNITLDKVEVARVLEQSRNFNGKGTHANSIIPISGEYSAPDLFQRQFDVGLISPFGPREARPKRRKIVY
jgi:hypothetical protein